MNKEYFEDSYVKSLREEGFTDEQIAYFSPEHTYKQARIIKKGIKLGLDVSIYNNPKFDYKQMYEILIGLDEGIAVEEYNHLDYSSEKMNLIRLCLERGIIEVLKYKKLDDDILELIVKCWFNDKDLTHYVKSEKYCIEQLKEIAQGILNGLKISIYAKPEFNGNQMREIRKGIEKNLEVSIYANPKFDSHQMKYLREELMFITEEEPTLPTIEDIRLIARPYCTIDEMREELSKVNSLRDNIVT